MKALTEASSTVSLGDGRICYAPGIKAGPWIFATGHMATDFEGGLSTSVFNPKLPYRDAPKNQKEAEHIFDKIEHVLASFDSGLQHIVRLDQYYPRHEAVDPYHIVRRRRLAVGVPASTSILVKDLLLQDAEVTVDCIAIQPGPRLRVEHFADPRFQGHPTSGFSAAVRAGDFVFVPGVVASALPGEPHRNGMAVEALVVEGSLWKGCPIALETEYCLKRKIEPSLALAGSSLRNIVKAQVYLTHPEDLAPFLFTWNKYFSDNPPALTVVLLPRPGFATYSARTEINVIALTDTGQTKKEIITADVPTVLSGAPAAVRAGDLMFLSGLYPASHTGLADGVATDPRQPYFSSHARAQARAIIEIAEKICHTAGTSLKQVVRLQQYHSDLREFYETHLTWREYLPDTPLPFSAVEVASATPLPGATLMTDLWIYAPQP